MQTSFVLFTGPLSNKNNLDPKWNQEVQLCVQGCYQGRWEKLISKSQPCSHSGLELKQIYLSVVQQRSELKDAGLLAEMKGMMYCIPQ